MGDGAPNGDSRRTSSADLGLRDMATESKFETLWLETLREYRREVADLKARLADTEGMPKNGTDTTNTPEPEPVYLSTGSGVVPVQSNASQTTYTTEGETFELQRRPGFERSDLRRDSKERRRLSSALFRSSSSSATSSNSNDKALDIANRIVPIHLVALPVGRWVALDPDGLFRTWVNACSAFVLLFDAFLVPLIVAWDVKYAGGWRYTAWFPALFWTLDIPLSMLTGNRNADNKIDIRLDKTSKLYMRSWFMPDVAMVTCHWLGMFLGDGNVYLRVIGSLARAIRGVRLLPRLADLRMKVRFAFPFQGAHIALDVSLLMVIMIYFTHFVCCGWYMISRMPYLSDSGSSWLAEFEEQSDILPEVAHGMTYQYTTSLHWAVTQLSPGSMEVVPNNSSERIYSIIILLISLIFGSSFTATLASMMTQYRMRLEETSNKFLQLQLYLRQERVQKHVGIAVIMHVASRQKDVKTRLRMKDVSSLSVASQSVKDALIYTIRMKVLSSHPLIGSLNVFDQSGVKAICTEAFETNEYIEGDSVFDDDSSGSSMFFFAHGLCRYRPGTRETASPWAYSDDRLKLVAGDWCSEPALFFVWTHVGTLLVEETAEAYTLKSDDFRKVLTRYSHIHKIVCQYVAIFCNTILESNLSDLPHVLDYQEVMSMLPHDTRVVLAHPIISRLPGTSRGSRDSEIDLLMDQISQGKCGVGLMGSEVVRTVFVLAIRIWNIPTSEDEHRFLVKLCESEIKQGKIKIKASCKFPGTKRRAEETAVSAIERCFSSELKQIDAIVDLKGRAPERTIFYQNSAETGVRTRYQRATYDADVTEALTMFEISSSRVPEESLIDSWLNDEQVGFFERTFQWKKLAEEKVVKQAFSKVIKSVKTVLKLPSSNAGESGLFAWVTADEMEKLKLPCGQRVLQKWAEFVLNEDREPELEASSRTYDSATEV
eukprot:TRINITY_DN22020_c0_g1_i2.p1 TRINITY_DN22020_c0_g1~~TRINITY_DN22020_c0_g1_i2.p1  ORF type:complete len:942 (-),score=112.88 TRINITY_DN22020_c0_g1_i2:236-3061(-)